MYVFGLSASPRIHCTVVNHSRDEPDVSLNLRECGRARLLRICAGWTFGDDLVQNGNQDPRQLRRVRYLARAPADDPFGLNPPPETNVAGELGYRYNTQRCCSTARTARQSLCVMCAWSIENNEPVVPI
jgi:hypothetical protein